jgi:hypothetical protein
MADYRQKRKFFLTVRRPIATVDRQILSFPIERFQPVKGVLFLILKKPADPVRRRARIKRAGEGGGHSILMRRPAKAIYQTIKPDRKVEASAIKRKHNAYFDR